MLPPKATAHAVTNSNFIGEPSQDYKKDGTK
jgi:hypothetical protein